MYVVIEKKDIEAEKRKVGDFFAIYIIIHFFTNSPQAPVAVPQVSDCV